MRNPKKWREVLSVILLVATTGGCQENAQEANQAEESNSSTTVDASGDAKLVQQIKNLKTLGLVWHSYHDKHKKGPANWDELIAFGQNTSALTELRDSGCVVTGWGLRFAEVTIGTSNFVLAYSQEAKQDKGPVLLMDGFVVEKSAADLQKALDNQKSIGGGK